MPVLASATSTARWVSRRAARERGTTSRNMPLRWHRPAWSAGAKEPRTRHRRAGHAQGVCDEVYGYMSSHPQNPLPKRPLVALMKRARASGTVVFVALLSLLSPSVGSPCQSARGGRRSHVSRRHDTSARAPSRHRTVSVLRGASKQQCSGFNPSSARCGRADGLGGVVQACIAPSDAH